jgi:putative effector of murein hydrolase
MQLVAIPMSWLRLPETLAFGTALTLAAYWAGVAIQKKLRGNPLANPVLIAMMTIAAMLLLTGTSYQEYFAGARIVHFLLGPATVALAVPLAGVIRRLRSVLKGAIAAIAAGAFVSAATGLWMVRLLGGSALVAESMAPKAATTPIAMGIAQGVGGDPSLTATFAILAGILVSITVEHLLGWAQVRDWRAYGLAAGTAGSGIGTARAFQLNEQAGAFAGLALGLNGLATAILVPLLVHLTSLVTGS